MQKDIKMHHYIIRAADGITHVQNVVGPYLGQHHLYDDSGFATWLAKAGLTEQSDRIIITDYTHCNCGQTRTV